MQSINICDDCDGKIITLYIQSLDKVKIRYRMKELQHFRDLFDDYCTKQMVCQNQMRFKYNNEEIDSTCSPFLLDMKNGAIIHSLLRHRM